MSEPTGVAEGNEDVRRRCAGVVPLSGRLEAWQISLCRTPARLAQWLDDHGSPLNVLHPALMARGAAELEGAARASGVELRIFFARKANKAVACVDMARDLGLGVDVASECELLQTLERGVPADDVVVTAAVKPREFLEHCVTTNVTTVVDNEDELVALGRIAAKPGKRVEVALRLAPYLGFGRPESRFGFTAGHALDITDRYCAAKNAAPFDIAGVHFHLDGYDPGDRVAGITQGLDLIDTLRARGHAPRFIDIGGGIPMRYLNHPGEWECFWTQHRAALRGHRPPLTFEGHGLGLIAHHDEILGRANVYPAYQHLTGGDWLAEILRSPLNGSASRETVADAVRRRGLELRCEPGRFLVDGCGLTAARVEFRKQRRDGTWLIGLAMNRTQCRSTADDFLVDPLLIRTDAGARSAGRETGPIEGYLVGAYCIEREFLSWRLLSFPDGVRVGDTVVFPNTAGYLMHILESASHQIPLARNLVVGNDYAPILDAIDRGASGSVSS